MSSHHVLYTSIGITVHIKDGQVTGVESDDGWTEPEIEEWDDETGEVIEDRFTTDDIVDILKPLSGRWEVKALP
jgi:hypothetical protein